MGRGRKRELGRQNKPATLLVVCFNSSTVGVPLQVCACDAGGRDPLGRFNEECPSGEDPLVMSI